MKLGLFFPFFLYVCISVSRSISAHMRGCMISPGDRILRACNNCRANANAWLVALAPASAELRSGPQCSAGFGPGTKPKIARLGLFYPRAFNIRLCRTSRVHISRSTIGFRKDTTCHALLMGESLPPGYCPCCFVLSALYLFFQASFFFQVQFLYLKEYTVCIKIQVKEDMLPFLIFSWLHLL